MNSLVDDYNLESRDDFNSQDSESMAQNLSKRFYLFQCPLKSKSCIVPSRG